MELLLLVAKGIAQLLYLLLANIVISQTRIS